MRKPWIVVFIAVFLMSAVASVQVEAAGGSTDGGNVADLFKDKHAPQTVGDNESGKKDVPAATTSGTVWMFVKVIFVLGVVVALIYLLLRFVHARTKSFSEGRSIETMGGVSVGSNRSVQLVKVGSRILVVGVGESISLLKEIENEEEVGELTKQNEREDLIDQSVWRFKDWLKKKKTTENSGGRFKKVLEDRLKQMTNERRNAVDRYEKKGFRK
ncbi:MAG TPA: flagellar biosynthetic protein FliO [Bacillales bacterium]|nr:flagellar biosynthetic protein FliO [Bacillales bacterium]